MIRVATTNDKIVIIDREGETLSVETARQLARHLLDAAQLISDAQNARTP